MSAPWTPRIGIDLDVASGDRGRGSPTLGTFNAFFQSGTYSGRAQLLGSLRRSMDYVPVLVPTRVIEMVAT